MLATSLLLFSIGIGTILLSIHNRDEIHVLMAWLSGFVGLTCILILTPLWLKSVLGLFFFVISHKILPMPKSLR